MPKVRVGDFGVIEFPDSLSSEDIANRLKFEIIPQIQGKEPQRPWLVPDPTGETSQVAVTAFHRKATDEEFEGLQGMTDMNRAQMLAHYRGNRERLMQEAVQRGQSRPGLKDVADDMINTLIGGKTRGSANLPEANGRLQRVAALHQNPEFQALGKRNSRTAGLLATFAANNNPRVPELFLRAASGGAQAPEYDIQDYSPELLDTASHFLVSISTPERLRTAQAAGAMSPLGARKFAAATIREAAVANGMQEEEAVALLQSPEVQTILAGAEQGAYGRALGAGVPLTKLLGVEEQAEPPKPLVRLPKAAELSSTLTEWEPGIDHKLMRTYARGLILHGTTLKEGGKPQKFLKGQGIEGAGSVNIPGFGSFNLDQLAKEEHEPGWVEGVVEGIIGIVADPVNAVTFKLGGFLGALPLASRANAMWQLGAKTGSKAMQRGAELMVRSGSGFGGLGLFGAQQEALLNDKATFWSVMEAGLKEGVLGAALGPASLPGGSRAFKMVGGQKVFTESVKKYLARNFAAFNLEAMTFGVGSPLIHGERPSWQSMADSYGMIGGLKILHVVQGPARRAAEAMIPVQERSTTELRSAALSQEMAAELGSVGDFMRRLGAENASRDVQNDARALIKGRPTLDKQGSEAVRELRRRAAERGKAEKEMEPALEKDALAWGDDPANLLHHFQTWQSKRGRRSPADPFFEEVGVRVAGQPWAEGARALRGELVGEFGRKEWDAFLKDQGYEVPGRVSLKGFRKGEHAMARRAAQRTLSEPVDYETMAGTLRTTRAARVENLVAQGKPLVTEGKESFLGGTRMESKTERDYAEHMAGYLRAKFEAMPSQQLEGAARKFGLAREVLEARDQMRQDVAAEAEAESMNLQAGAEAAGAEPPIPAVGLERRAPARQAGPPEGIPERRAAGPGPERREGERRGLPPPSHRPEGARRKGERRGAPQKPAEAPPKPPAPTEARGGAERRGEGRREGEERRLGTAGHAEEGGRRVPPPRREGERRQLLRRAGEGMIEEAERQLGEAKAGRPEALVRQHDVTGLPEGKPLQKVLLKQLGEESIRSGEALTVVEGDFRNLGGLNAKLTEAGTDPHLRAMTEIAHKILKKLGVEGEDFIFGHKGGDELFLVFPGKTRAEVEPIMLEIERATFAYAKEQGLSEIPHKKGGAPGTGISFGVTGFDSKVHRAGWYEAKVKEGEKPRKEYLEAAEVATRLAQADLELAKARGADEYRKRVEGAGDRPGPAAGEADTGAGAGEGRAPEGPRVERAPAEQVAPKETARERRRRETREAAAARREARKKPAAATMAVDQERIEKIPAPAPSSETSFNEQIVSAGVATASDGTVYRAYEDAIGRPVVTRQSPGEPLDRIVGMRGASFGTWKEAWAWIKDDAKKYRRPGKELMGKPALAAPKQELAPGEREGPHPGVRFVARTPTTEEVEAAAAYQGRKYTAAEIIGAHPKGATIPKDFAGERAGELKRQATEALGRPINEAEAKFLEEWTDNPGFAAVVLGVVNAEEAIKGGPAGLDFARWARNSPAVPLSTRKALGDAIQQALGGMDVPSPEQIKPRTPPKKLPPPESVIGRSVSTDEGRPAMNAVAFDKDGTVVSTDGHRLMAIMGGPPREETELRRPAKGGGFEAPLVDEVFPNWRQVIPKGVQPMRSLTRDTAASLAGVIEATRKANPHKAPGAPGASSFAVAISGKGKDPAIFNGGFFLDMLDSMVDLGVENMSFSLGDPKSALIIKGKTPDGRDVLSLLMPLKPVGEIENDRAGILDLREAFQTGDMSKVPRPPYGVRDLAVEGEGMSAGPIHFDRLYTFPGPLFEPEAWKAIAQSAKAAGAQVAQAGGPAAIASGKAIRTTTQALQWRLFGQEGVQIGDAPIQLSPLDPFKNQESILRQTPQGSRIFDSATRFKDTTNRDYTNFTDAFDAIKKGMEKSFPSRRATRRGMKALWSEVLEGLDTGSPTPRAEPHVEALRQWYDSLHEYARKAGVPIGYRENYLSHMFNGDYWIKSEGEFSRPFSNFGEALQELARARMAGKDATLEMDVYVPPFEGQATSRRGFWRAASELHKLTGERLEVIGNAVGLPDLGQMLADMGKGLETGEFAELLREGKVLRPLPRHRFFANMLRRVADNPYFSRDPSIIFPNYTYGLVRKVTQDRFLREVQTQIEDMPLSHSELKRTVMDYYMPAVLGHPTPFEKGTANWFGRTVMGRPVEPGAVRQLVSSVAGVQFLFDLGASIASAGVNATQTWANTYPIIGEKSFLEGEAAYWRSMHDPKIGAEVREVAVAEHVSPITHRRIEHGARQLAHPLGLFQEMEYHNRVSSYFGGKHYAAERLKGLAPAALPEAMRELAKKVTPSGTAKARELGPLYDRAAMIEGMLKKARRSKWYRKYNAFHPQTVAAIGRQRALFERHFGKELSDKTQFRVGRENLPSVLNNGPLQAIFPYKSFMLNQIGLSYRYLRLHPEYAGGPLARRSSWRRAGVWEDPIRWTRHAAMSFALGGIFGSPFLLAGFHVLNAIYRKVTGEDLRHELRKLHFERGLLSKLGLDISGNFAVHMPNPQTFFDDTAGRLVKVGWHAVQYLPDGYDVFEKRRMQRDLLPAQVRRIADAWETYKAGEVVTPIRRELVDMTGKSTLDRAKNALRTAVGAQDPRIRAYFDDREELLKRQERFQGRRAAINERLAESVRRGEPKIVDAVVEDIIEGLTESLEKMDKAKSERSFSLAADDFLFWFSTLQFTGEGFPNAVERKFLPKEIRDYGEYPSYQRYEAMVRLLEEEQ